MASSAILLLSLMLPQSTQGQAQATQGQAQATQGQAQAAETLAAFDLGYAQADLVVIASPKGFAGDRVPIEIHQTLKGHEVQRVFVIQPRAYGLHVRLPAKATPHLIFLKKTASGYMPLQRQGIQIPVPSKSRRLRSLTTFFGLLGKPDSFCRDITRFASSHIQADPLLARAALLALARRPDLAPRINKKAILELRRWLQDPTQDAALRDLSARCLASAKDPGLPAQMLDLLGRGQSQKLGTLFGRLLAASSHASAAADLGRLQDKVSPAARVEIRHCLNAMMLK